MAKLYADSMGAVLRLLMTIQEYDEFPTAPMGTTATLDFDPATNQSLIAAYNANPAATQYLNGVLTQSGHVVTVQPAGADYQTRDLITKVAQALASGEFQGANVTLAQANQDWQAIQAGTATGQQVQRFLVFLGRVQGYVLRTFLNDGLI